MIFWRKKEPAKAVEPVNPVKENKLTILMTDGAILSWTCNSWAGRIEPWKRFYKWYFGRTGEAFIIRYVTGETMIKRSDIVRFMVQVEEEKSNN